MEENVALDSSKQKKFVKSIKGLKKLIKKNKLESAEQPAEQPEKPTVAKSKLKSISGKKKKSNKGLVYLSHIPHGFYEHEMTEYFKQFGTVTNVRVIRSERTGRSKGYAFVEFKQPVVAEIVAETMNNYLMGKRLIKAAYIPPEKIRLYAKRKNWSTVWNPCIERKIKHKKEYNGIKTEKDSLKIAKKILSNLKKTKVKLNELGINYDFTPVDIPEALLDVKIEKESIEPVKTEVSVKLESKKKGKKFNINKENEPEVKDTLALETKQNKIDKKNKKVKKTKKQETKIDIIDSKKEIQLKEASIKTLPDKKKSKGETKTENTQGKVGKKNKKDSQKVIDNDKELKLKKANVKPLEDFIKVQVNSDSDDDSSVVFDSDEYEKMMKNDHDYDSSEIDNDDDLRSSENEESVIDFPPKKIGKSIPKSVPIVTNKKSTREGQKKNKSPQVKRKANSMEAVTPKKPKFEKKQVKKVVPKKQFKKKK